MTEVLIHPGIKLSQLQKKINHVKGFRFRRNYGKAAALHTGFNEASGDVVITMDSDLQDSPDEIPELDKDDQERRIRHCIGMEKEKI